MILIDYPIVLIFFIPLFLFVSRAESIELRSDTHFYQKQSEAAPSFVIKVTIKQFFPKH